MNYQQCVLAAISSGMTWSQSSSRCLLPFPCMGKAISHPAPRGSNGLHSTFSAVAKPHAHYSQIQLCAARLRRYGHTAIVAMDAAQRYGRVRGKTRVLLTRFLARALLCPIYTPEWLDSSPQR